MTNSADIRETLAAREAIAKAKASASAAASMPGSMPNKGTVHPQQPVVTHVTTGNGGNHPPHSPNKGGGGGSSGSGGFGSWWRSLHYSYKIIIWMMVAMCFSSLLGMANIWMNRNIAGERNINAINRSEAELIIARNALEKVAIEEKIAASKARISGFIQKSNTSNAQFLPVTMPVVKAPTFDCSTDEKMEQNFARLGTISLQNNTQSLFKNGCAWIMIDREIATLQGSGYAISFDPVTDPGAQYCGEGRRGRNNSPEQCLTFLNQHIGQKVRVEIKGDSSSFFKIG